MSNHNNGNFICTNCGVTGQPKTIKEGSFWVELVLWIFLLIPGIVYSVWRLASKEKVCPICGQPSMIPINTPKGARLLKENK